ncbi:MAG: hypothetical protein ACE5GE_12275, partial [Phycisphaerae bacterium]
PGETTLEVTDEGGTVVFSAGPLTAGATLHVFDVPVCSTGCYAVTIFDAFGDGICCGFGNGSYSVFFNGTLVGSGGEFGDSETVSDIGGCVSPFLGACCMGCDCLVTTETCCLFAGGTFNGGGTTCSAGLCTIPLAVTCPMDMTVECDGAGNTTELQAWLAGATASGGCGAVTLTNDFAGIPVAYCGATGSVTVTWTATDEVGQVAMCTTSFTIVDTVTPTVNCSATPVAARSEDDDDHDNLLIGFDASDVCGELACGAVGISAVIDTGCGMIPVVDGQILEVECEMHDGRSRSPDDSDCEAEWQFGLLEIEAPMATLIVTSTDVCGNTGTCTIDLCQYGALRAGDNDPVTKVKPSAQGNLSISVGQRR